MPKSSSQPVRPRAASFGRASLCWAIALALAGAGVPRLAVAAAPKKVTPADADTKRLQVQQSARPLTQAGDHGAAGIAYDNGAAEWGDPVLYLEAADSYLAAADAKRDEAMVDAAVERAKIALDILYFQLDAQADKDFRLVEQSDVPTLVARANSTLDKAEDVRAAIAAEAAAPPPPPAEPKKKKPRKPGRAMIIAGASLTAVGGIGLGVGVAGLAIGAYNQNQAEEPTVYGKEYDAVEQKGKRGNAIAIAGLAVGGAAAIVGIVLIVIGKKQQKKAGGGGSVAVAPTLNGISISGRF